MTRFLTGFFCTIFLLSSLTVAQAGSYKEAVAAYKAKDYATARSILKQLAKSGQAKSVYAYGKMIHDGKGGTKNRKQGLKLMEQAAGKGYTPAMIGLARVTVKNYGREKNYRDGCLWYRQAAENGNRIGMTATAKCYMKGNGAPETPQDMVQALAWFTAADNLGRKAIKFITDLENLLEPGEIAQARQMAKAYAAGKKSTIVAKAPAAKPQKETNAPPAIAKKIVPKPVKKTPQPAATSSTVVFPDGNQRALECFDLSQGQESCIQACQSDAFKKKHKRGISKKEGWAEVAYDSCLSGCASTKTVFIEASAEYGEYKDSKFFCPAVFQKVESAIRNHKKTDPKNSGLGHLKKNTFASGQIAFRDGAYTGGLYGKFAYETVPVQLKNTPQVETILAEFPERLPGCYNTAGVLDQCTTYCDSRKAKSTKGLTPEVYYDLCVQGCQKGGEMFRDQYAWTNKFQNTGDYRSICANIDSRKMAIQELRAEAEAQKIEYINAMAIQGGAMTYWSIAMKAK